MHILADLQDCIGKSATLTLASGHYVTCVIVEIDYDNSRVKIAPIDVMALLAKKQINSKDADAKSTYLLLRDISEVDCACEPPH